MGRTGEMLIDVTDGDTIKQVQLEEHIDDLMLRINELENKNKMLASEKLLIFVNNKELKADIATMKRKNNLLKTANKIWRGRMDKYRLANKRWTTTQELNIQLQVDKNDEEYRKQSMRYILWTFCICFVITFVSIVLFG